MLKRCQYEGAAKIFFPSSARPYLRHRTETVREEARRTGAGGGRGAGKRGTRGNAVEAAVALGQSAHASSPRPPTAVPRPRVARDFPPFLRRVLSTWRPVDFHRAFNIRSRMNRERGVTKKSRKKKRKRKKEAFIRDVFPGTRGPGDPRTRTRALRRLRRR
jgi:hypothetical protein